MSKLGPIMAELNNFKTMASFKYIGTRQSTHALASISKQLVNAREEVVNERTRILEWNRRQSEDLKFKFNQLHKELTFLRQEIAITKTRSK